VISKEELIKIAKKNNLKPFQQEKHYIQTIILSGIYSSLTNELVFKGGTALFFFYGLNRFSEDLDFTKFKNFDMKKVKESIRNTFELLNIPNRIKEMKTPAGKKIKIKAEGPLYRGELSECVVDLDISNRNDLVLEAETKEVIPIYNDVRPFTISVMQKEEILSEKIRAVIKRDKARDVYDLWFLLKKGIDFDLNLVNKKMKYYKEKFDYDELKLNIIKSKKYWNSDLKGLLPVVPSFNEASKLILSEIKD